jgi:hypothetical protein
VTSALAEVSRHANTKTRYVTLQGVVSQQFYYGFLCIKPLFPLDQALYKFKPALCSLFLTPPIASKSFLHALYRDLRRLLNNKIPLRFRLTNYANGRSGTVSIPESFHRERISVRRLFLCYSIISTICSAAGHGLDSLHLGRIVTKLTLFRLLCHFGLVDNLKRRILCLC